MLFTAFWGFIFSCLLPTLLSGECSNSTGTYTSDWSSCIKCPKGYYCPDPAKNRIACARGFYQPQAGNSTGCQPCELGYYCNELAMSYQISCPIGYYCPKPDSSPIKCGNDQYQPNKNSIKCLAKSDLKCALGTYVDNNGVCAPCPKGSYCPDPVDDPVPCPGGTYQPDQGKSSQKECIVCPKGSHSTWSGQISCPLCPEGSYCEGNNTIYDCQKGTYQPDKGKSNKSDCIECPQGYYANDRGQSSCSRCPKGSYCPAKNNTYIECPKGTYQPDFGKVDKKDCISCPKGYYSFGGEAACTICPKGSFCLGGSKELCPQGTFQNASGNDTCLACEKGFYYRGTGAVSCLACPTGSFCNFADDYTYCPKGTYQNESNATSCLDCSTGYYADTTGNTYCKKCKEGFFCNSTYTDYKEPSKPWFWCGFASSLKMICTTTFVGFLLGVALGCYVGVKGCVCGEKDGNNLIVTDKYEDSRTITTYVTTYENTTRTSYCKAQVIGFTALGAVVGFVVGLCTPCSMAS